MNLTYKRFFAYIVLSYLIVASILGTNSSEADHLIAKLYSLPNYVDDFNKYFYFFYIFILNFIGFIFLIKARTIQNNFLYILISYFILLFFSFINFSDFLRYFLIFLSVLFVPYAFAYILSKCEIVFLAKRIQLIGFFFLIISLIYSLLNYSVLTRMSGIHNNPNLMGMWIVSLTVIILYFKEYLNNLILYIYLILAFFLVFMTGSRLDFLFLIIVIIPIFLKFKWAIIFISIPIVFYLLMGDYSGNLGDARVMELDSAIEDSGRIYVWDNAFKCIIDEPLLGQGMNGAENCVKSGNVHNSYLRVFVMIGIPSGILFFIFYFLFLFKSFFSKINIYLRLYFLALPFCFFAEDYIVGFASPFFAFFLMILSLSFYDLKFKNRKVF